LSEKTRVVIVGGGYGGVKAAQVLAKLLRSPKDADIVLIDRNPFHTLMTELHEVAGWRSGPESVMVSFERIFPGDKVRVVVDEVKTIDFDAKAVKAGTGDFPYDYLVLGSGSETEDFGVPGVKERALKLWSLDDALAVRERVDRAFLEASRETDAERRKELLTFAVAGAGFTGIELAGELAEHRDAMCERYHLDRAETRVVVIEALPKILTILDDGLRAKAERLLAKLGVELMLNAAIVGVEESLVKIKDGRAVRAGTFVWTCGVAGTAFAGNLDLTKGKCMNRACPHSRGGSCSKKICEFKTERGGVFVEGKRGRILVDQYLRSVDYPDVYVVGDAPWFIEGGKPLPQIVETAVQTAERAARNIAAEATGRGKAEPFKSNYHGFMVSIGSRYAVQNLKLPGLLWLWMGVLALAVLVPVTAAIAGAVTKAGFVASLLSPWQLIPVGASIAVAAAVAIVMRLSVFAMGMKHLVNLHYLWGVAGFNGVFNYLRHAFFRRDDGRTFWPGRLVGHRVQGLWVVILRMFTGAMWFIEGVGKLSWIDPKNSGWVNKFLFGIDPPVKPEDVQAAADAVAAASAVWEGEVQGAANAGAAAVDAASAASVAADTAVASVDAATATAKAAASAAGGIFLPPLVKEPTALYRWVLALFIGDGSKPWQLAFAYLFRFLIVIGEVGVGLALFGGAFTFLASGVSIVLCILFLLSGMATREIFWYLCAGLTLLGAAGKSAGLDNWIIPFVDRFWRGSRLGRATKLYPDEPVSRRKR